MTPGRTLKRHQPESIMPNAHKQEITAIFADLETVLRRTEYTDVDLFDLIGSFSDSSPTIAKAMSFHARDILGSTNEEANYTDIMVEVFRRTFFDDEMAARYGTNMMIGNPVQARGLVDYITTRSNLDSMGKSNVIPLQRPTSVN